MAQGNLQRQSAESRAIPLLVEGGDLAALWKEAPRGRLSPLMQAKAWGLSEAGLGPAATAEKVTKAGGVAPTREADAWHGLRTSTYY